MTIILTILALAFLILAHEFGHFVMAKIFKMRVDEFGIGFPPRILSKKIGETLYSLNALPLGGFVRIFGENALQPGAAENPRSFMSQSASKRAAVIVAGVVMNFLAGWAVVAAIFFIGTPKGIAVQEILPGSPAAEAGFSVGDIIIDFSKSDDFLSFVDEHKGQAVNFSVVGPSGKGEVSVTPRAEPKEGEGALGIIISETGLDPQPFFASLVLGFKTSIGIIIAVFAGLAELIKSLFTEGKLVEGLMGPVGVFGLAAKSASAGAVFFLQLIGLISLNLAALNIMPFPALDGGRLLFIIFEKIKGNKLTPKFELIANAVGFSLLITFILAVTARDIAKLF